MTSRYIEPIYEFQMTEYDDFPFPENFNAMSDDDWNEYVSDMLRRGNPIEEGMYESPLDLEEWHDIPGFPSYQVSRNGLVRSLHRGYPIVLKPWRGEYGHLFVQLFDRDGNGKKVLVHRLMAEAFMDNPHGYPIVRHLNDVHDDNRLENLAWGTSRDNSADMVRNNHDAHKEVYCYETGHIYRSGREAARALGVTPGAITMACKGKNNNSVCGMHLCFLSDKDYKMQHLDEWITSWDRGRKPIVAEHVLSHEKIYFPSRKEAARQLNIPDCGISSVVTGHIKHTHGWTFYEPEGSK